MTDKQYQLSQAAFDRLKEELQHLTTVGRIDIARRIEAARELGDLKENGDYHAAKDEQGKMEARIGHLSALTENAVILADDAVGDEVEHGCIVTVVYDGDDEEERYLIGMIEERRDGVEIVSPSSPLGEALLGRKAGDTVSYEAPHGELRVRIVNFER